MTGIPARQRRLGALTMVAGCLLGGVALGWPAAAAARAAAFDVNGDGYADLVTGVPGESVAGVDGAGAVSVLYGGPDGVTATGNRLVHQNTAGVVGGNEDGDRFGSSVASGDFDRDGYADVAVGATGEGDDTVRPHGAVTVLYGGSRGVSGAGGQRFSSGAIGTRFSIGGRLAVGDLNGDGYPDLAINGAGVLHGSVTVLHGSRSGLRLAGAVRLTEASANLPGPAPRIDGFGAAMAVGDITGDGIADLVVKSRNSMRSKIWLFRGRARGLATSGDQVLFEDDPDVAPEGTELGSLGEELAVGDFDGDGHGDLAAGDTGGGPDGCSQSIGCPGVVLLVPGSSTGLDVSRRQLFSPGSTGLPGSADEPPGYGAGLAAGDLDADGLADLGIGAVPGVGSRSTGGSVDVLYGSGTGLSGAGAQQWSQDSTGLPGTGEEGDGFGLDLRITQMDGVPGKDLAVWVPGESVGSVPNAGSVSVLYAEPDTGLQAERSRGWNQGSRRVLGSPEEWDQYGVMRQGQ